MKALLKHNVQLPKATKEFTKRTQKKYISRILTPKHPNNINILTQLFYDCKKIIQG